MKTMEERINGVVGDLTRNESLVQMLETDVASELLNWGVDVSKSVVNETDGLDDEAANLAMEPRLKAIRQTMRSIGNWAAGKYIEPESRIQLRDKLIEPLRAIFGKDVSLPSVEQLDELLNQVDDKNKTPHELILGFRALLESNSPGGGNHAET